VRDRPRAGCQGQAQLEHSVETRLYFRSKCPVKALASQACILGDLRHSPGMGYIAQREQEQIRIVHFGNCGQLNALAKRPGQWQADWPALCKALVRDSHLPDD
jgi:hypothetical protein